MRPVHGMPTSRAGAARVAVVSGAAAGVGRATVEALIADGFVVVGVDLAEPADALNPLQRVEWVQGDIASQDTWDRVLAATRRHDPLGPECFAAAAADVVVAPFLETTPEDFARLFEVNVVGTLRGMQTLMPPMIARARGAIAVVCSVDSLFVEVGLSAYSASKAGLLQIVRSAAVEHAADGLRVNAVLPGAIESAFLRRALAAAEDPEAELRAATGRIPSGRILQPREVAEVLRFLLGDSASGLSGAAIAVDGALTATYQFEGLQDQL